MKPYLFTYSAACSQAAVHTILNATNAIENWIAPFPHSAILVSNLDTRELGAILRHHLNGAWFVVTQIDSQLIDGWLPGDMWKYVNSPSEASLAKLIPHQPYPPPPPPPPTGGIGGLMAGSRLHHRVSREASS